MQAKYILMTKMIKNITLCLFAITLFSCDDDETTASVTPAVPLEEQAPIDDALLIEFLNDNYYNEEAFANADLFDSGVFNHDISFSETATVTGLDTNGDGVIDASDADNTTVFNRQALIDLVETKVITIDDVDHNLYILRVNQGGGLEQPKFCDSTYMDYKGIKLDKETFDASVNPIWLDLVLTIKGFSESISEFNTAESFSSNGDGTNTFVNFGNGAVFMPSGLGYYANGSTSIPAYSPLVFTFKIFDAVENTDHDNDGIPSYLEDLNEDRILTNDDTDSDTVPNYNDINDDNDPLLTKDEDVDGDGDPTNDDTDGDGIANYLDSDS